MMPLQKSMLSSPGHLISKTERAKPIKVQRDDQRETAPVCSNEQLTRPGCFSSPRNRPRLCATRNIFPGAQRQRKRASTPLVAPQFVVAMEGVRMAAVFLQTTSVFFKAGQRGQPRTACTRQPLRFHGLDPAHPGSRSPWGVGIWPLEPPKRLPGSLPRAIPWGCRQQALGSPQVLHYPALGWQGGV